MEDCKVDVRKQENIVYVDIDSDCKLVININGLDDSIVVSEVNVMPTTPSNSVFRCYVPEKEEFIRRRIVRRKCSINSDASNKDLTSKPHLIITPDEFNKGK